MWKKPCWSQNFTDRRNLFNAGRLSAIDRWSKLINVSISLFSSGTVSSEFICLCLKQGVGPRTDKLHGFAKIHASCLPAALQFWRKCHLNGSAFPYFKLPLCRRVCVRGLSCQDFVPVSIYICCCWMSQQTAKSIGAGQKISSEQHTEVLLITGARLKVHRCNLKEL